jgi:NlpC/P60 family putative phage cell wall peptidase
MITRDDVVREALTWVGTPYQHQGRVKGVGTDCAGMVIGTARALGLEYGDRAGYGRLPDSNMFMRVIESHTDPVDVNNIQPGDLLVFAWLSSPQHIAIVTKTNPFIMIVHAWAGVGYCVEHRLDSAWRSKVRACRSFRGVSP